MPLIKSTKWFFKKFFEAIESNGIEVGPLTRHLSALKEWESRNQGDPISNMTPAPGKQMTEFKRCSGLVGGLSTGLGIVEQHCTDTKKTRELTSLQAGLEEYEKLLKKKLKEAEGKR